MQYVNDEETPERQMTPEEYLQQRKTEMRRRSWWAVGIGAAIIVFHLVVFALAMSSEEFGRMLSWKDLLRSIFFLLGLFAFAGGIWGLREAKRMRLEDLIPTPEAIEFAQQAENTVPYYSYIFIACFVAVQLAQFNAGLDESVAATGLISEAVWQRSEFWRILTSGAMHYGFLHIYFNSQAFYGFGGLIETLSNRAHLAIVFLLSVIGGNLLSLAAMPDVPSVGASGGIMGMVGYLAIYGHRRKQQLPPDFLRSLLVNIAFIAAFGIIGYQFINNAAHLGGLIVGAIYGFLQIPRSLETNPRPAGALTEGLGMIAVGIFVFVSILTVLLLTGTIKF